MLVNVSKHAETHFTNTPRYTSEHPTIDMFEPEEHAVAVATGIPLFPYQNKLFRLF